MPPAAVTARTTGRAVVAGGTAMVFVGGSVAISAVLTDGPLFTAQAVRYAAASVLLMLLAWVGSRPIVRPRGREWFWLLGVVLSGLVLFNVALVKGAAHAEPAVFGVAVACVPLVLAIVGSLISGRRPRPALLVAALIVTFGAALVQGVGRSDALGLGWAVTVLACELGFTLFAVPVLGRHGAWGVSVHATWMAAAVFAGIGVLAEGPAGVSRLTGADWAAVSYLAVAVTAAAFVLWYSSVRTLGAHYAGLLTGVAPVAAVMVGLLLGAPAPNPLVWCGIGAVVLGLVLGMGSMGSMGE
jgi:drug/metabolite transporter (DMT)-like permease